MPTAAPARSRDKVRAHRARMRNKGMRLAQMWVPNTRSKAFRRKAHLESLAVANSPHVKNDQEFVEAIAAWNAVE